MSSRATPPHGRRRSVALVGAAVLTATALVPVAFGAAPAQAADPVYVNIVATNDFHGRIRSNGAEAGAAVLAGAVDQMRTQYANTVFAAAGDLIGASTFESFVANDKPTIDALNEAGLEVSAAGNHEFDQGYDDLVNRVLKPASASNPDGGASWKYLAANVKLKSNGNPALDPTWVKTFNPGSASEVKVGFVGAVTEHLPELVSPAGISQLQITDVVAAVNTEADALKASGVDIVVMLVHEGAPSTNCATMDDDPTSDFGSIVTGVNANVDAIVSGHTHLAYDCSFPVAAWADRPVKERSVVSAGQYGMNLNRLGFSYDAAANQLTGVEHELLALASCNDTCQAATPTWTAKFPADAATKTIVDKAVTQADVLGAAPLGKIGGAFSRARRPAPDNPQTFAENRGGESSLGNLVAEVQRWATSATESGSAQIAFMNPGGLRADMTGSGTDAFPRTLTYKQAAVVQPFANTLVNMRMTGAQIAALLEQQWQPTGSSRPFLRLGVSEGFTYTYDPAAAAGSRITGMWLNGTAVQDATSYSVTANSFLAAGGDNFTVFRDATQMRDSGKVDLAAMVDYLAEFADDNLPVDYGQRAVGVTFPAGAPATYRPGQTVAFDVSSLAMSGAGDATDTEVEVKLGGVTLGSAPVDNTVAPGATDDEAGKASVSVVVPASAAPGRRALTVTGATTGTSITVPITIAAAPKADAKITGTVTPRRVVAGKAPVKVTISVRRAGGPAAGKVLVKFNGKVRTVTLKNGRATLSLGKVAKPGRKVVTVAYAGNQTTNAAGKRIVFVVQPRKR
ncbi:bifunctional UDP-sugar hydrolase/5'-nucleotidase [Nocardioides sp. R-C-SC26]|uniref:bifunctional metallophosphatase/5'-nucleotidase n=1 Tax=Nocardioides sp. R-C-SC26 TaxID=2870414 RepID=UPI001E35944C|nr:bifunctional UDP-sugar hydrolase/5'-nucleotidase [Nocardioides sp. R-C-SC26]